MHTPENPNSLAIQYCDTYHQLLRDIEATAIKTYHDGSDEGKPDDEPAWTYYLFPDKSVLMTSHGDDRGFSMFDSDLSDLKQQSEDVRWELPLGEYTDEQIDAGELPTVGMCDGVIAEFFPETASADAASK